MEPVVVKAKFDFKTYFQIALRMHYGLRQLTSLAIAITCVTAFFFLTDNFDWFVFAGFILSMVLIFAVLKPFWIWYCSKKQMRTSRTLIEGITYYITHERIEGIAPESSAQTNWRLIKKVVEKDNYFLLLSGGMMFRYLPKSGFKSPNDIESFKEIVKVNRIKAYFK